MLSIFPLFHARGVENCRMLCVCVVRLCLFDTENAAKEQIQTLQLQLSEIHAQHTETLKACQIKANTKCNELEQHLHMARERENELVERLNQFTVQENHLRDNVQASEQEFAKRLQAATARDRELNEKLTQVTRQLKAESDRRIDLEEQLKSTEQRSFRRNSNGNCSANGNDGSANMSKTQMLEEEVDSLRSVLDLKQNEIAELRKQNHRLQAAYDELPVALTKISVLETRLEDLSIQYQAKVEEEQ